MYDVGTHNAAKAMNISGHRLEVGAPANLVVFEASSVLEALRAHAAPRAVIQGGKIVQRAKMERLAVSGEWEIGRTAS